MMMLLMILLVSLLASSSDILQVSALIVVPPNRARTSNPVSTTTRLFPPPLPTATTTRLYGIVDRIPLVGRFRSKKEVKQVPQIKVGDPIPKEIDVIPTGMDGTPTQIQEVIMSSSSNKSIIVGT
jgi:hypothetical protein